MTTEQKETIDRLKELVELRKGKNTIKYDNCICATSDLDLVLNLIQEQENEIDHWKNGFERELESNRENACELLKQDLIIRKKDNIIDELAKAFKQDDVRSVEEIKQFYERKVENESNDKSTYGK